MHMIAHFQVPSTSHQCIATRSTVTPAAASYAPTSSSYVPSPATGGLAEPPRLHAQPAEVLHRVGLWGDMLGKSGQYGLAAVFGLTASGWNGVFLAEVARLAPQDRIGETTGAVLTASYAGLLSDPCPCFCYRDLRWPRRRICRPRHLCLWWNGSAYPGRRTMNAHEIVAAVSSRRASAVEIVRAALDRIAAAKALNAVVTVDAERSLSDAAAIDRHLQLGESMPLAGVPVVIKDNIWVDGTRVTQGSRLFTDFVAPCDAIAVERLKKAGAIVVGMGATSEFACKGVTTSLLFGPTRHPLNPELTPGGSSGGPATAVAADLVPLAIGTDAGGSRRRPPAHVGVVGFKPSYGAIPYGPGFPEPFFDISVIAPIARNVADTVLAFEVMAGPDARNSHSSAG